jgi:hypothetical protein
MVQIITTVMVEVMAAQGQGVRYNLTVVLVVVTEIAHHTVNQLGEAPASSVDRVGSIAALPRVIIAGGVCVVYAYT